MSITIVPVPGVGTSNYGIVTRHFIDPANTQHEDWYEEESRLSGASALTIRSDGFTFQQGTDIISHMDERGAIHPRRYIVRMRFKGAAENVNADVIFCEEGPRITMTLFIPDKMTLVASDIISITHIPRRICPSNRMTNPFPYLFSCYVYNTEIGQMVPTYMVLGTDGVIHISTTSVGVSGTIVFTAQTFVYDTGKY